MKRFRSLTLLAFLAGCSSASEPGTTVVDAQVSWMEWPAEVVAGTPFLVRLTGYGVECREIFSFSLAPAIDNSAVTFEPYYVVSTKQQVCPLAVSQGSASAASPASPIGPNFDTLATVTGLSASTPRTYEIRAAANVSVAAATPGIPVRTFGNILVRPDTASSPHRNAGGSVSAWRDTADCLHLSPLYIVFLAHPTPAADSPIGPGFSYVVENPPDTTSYWSGFVQGYVYAPAKAICGDTVVFHLVTRE